MDSNKLKNMIQGEKEIKDKILTFEVDSRFVKEMANVMTKNKSKYPRGNHYKPIDKILLFEAMERHLIAVKEHYQYNTDMIDEDGCSHLVKVATNAMMLYIQEIKKVHL